MQNILLIFLSILLILLILAVLLIYKRLNEKTSEESLLKLLKSSGLLEDLNKVATYAKEVRDLHTSIEKLLLTPAKRGAIGEASLELILKDTLPPTNYEVRKRLPSGVVPDAIVYINEAKICIDSKFPLENYKAFLDAPEEKKETYKKLFLKDVKEHLDKVYRTYADTEGIIYSFVFVPSEAVYYFLLTEASHLINEYAQKGVLVISPSALSYQLKVIASTIHSFLISKKHKQVYPQLAELFKNLEVIEKEWNTLINTHLKHLSNKAEVLKKNFEEVKRNLNYILSGLKDKK